VPHAENLTFGDEEVLSAKWTSNVSQMGTDVIGTANPNHLVLFMVDSRGSFEGRLWGRTFGWGYRRIEELLLRPIPARCAADLWTGSRPSRPTN